MTDNTLNTEQQQSTQTPAESGGARLFTQDEVNKIVSDRLAREREKLAESSEYKAQYEAVKEELEGMKAEQARAAKEAAVRAYYQQKGVTGKALEIAIKGSAQEIGALEWADDRIKDFSSIDALIGGVFSGLVAHTVTQGADIPHPPICGQRPTGDEQIADTFKPKI